jgi:ribosomal protein S21
MSRDNQRPKIRGTSVLVKDDQVEKALRKFKNKIQDSGKMDEVRDRGEYVKPTTERRVAANKARRRHLKQVETDELNGKRVPRDGIKRRMY